MQCLRHNNNVGWNTVRPASSDVCTVKLEQMPAQSIINWRANNNISSHGYILENGMGASKINKQTKNKNNKWILYSSEK